MKKNFSKTLFPLIQDTVSYKKKSVSFMDTPFFVIPYYDYLKIN